MTTLQRISAAACAFSLCIAPANLLRAQQAKRGITPEDYLSFQFAGDPHLSPDGKVVAYVVTTIDPKKNRRESAVWLVEVDGSAEPRRISAEGFSSNSPRWSPDGRTLAMLSARSADAAPAAGETPKPQIYLLSMNGERAWRSRNPRTRCRVISGRPMVAASFWSPPLVQRCHSASRPQQRCAPLYAHPVQIQ